MVPDTRPAPALEMFRRFIGEEKMTLGPSYGPEAGSEDQCAGVVDRGTEAATMVLLGVFMISLVLVVCLYLRVRELEDRKRGSDGDESAGNEFNDGGVDYDTKLDISDRSERSTSNPLGYTDGSDDDEITEINLDTITTLKAEYLDGDDDM